MSWHFSQGLVEEYLEATCSDGQLYAQWSKTHTQRPFSPKDKTTDTSSHSLYGTTLEALTENDGEALLTWFLADSHARTLASREKGVESMATDQDYGHLCRESFAKYDQNSCSWKTRQRSLFGDLMSYSETWPRWGLMRDGVAYQQDSAAPPTKGTEYGSWGTPTASDWKGTCSGSEFTQRKKQFDQLTQGTQKDGSIYPNPTAYEALMGWPISWTELKPLETDKFQSWRQQHGAFLQEILNEL